MKAVNMKNETNSFWLNSINTHRLCIYKQEYVWLKKLCYTQTFSNILVVEIATAGHYQRAALSKIWNHVTLSNNCYLSFFVYIEKSSIQMKNGRRTTKFMKACEVCFTFCYTLRTIYLANSSVFWSYIFLIQYKLGSMYFTQSLYIFLNLLNLINNGILEYIFV